MNWAKGSEENGGPLLVVSLLGLLYCEESCVNFHMTVSSIFVVILKVNGYLLNVTDMSRYSLPLKLKTSTARSRGLLVHLLESSVECAGLPCAVHRFYIS